jgi:hypothetical protein
MGTPMKSPFEALLALTLTAALLLFTVTPSLAEEGNRSCSVKEVLKGGIYVYVRCQEQGKDIWLATVAREFKLDEVITFVNAPPMTDFYSKFLDRTFTEVIFTDLLPPGVQKK